MRCVRIFQHAAAEGPGVLGHLLDRHGLAAELIAVHAGAPIPPSLNGCSALVLLGGPMSVNDPLPWIDDEIALVRAALEVRRPVLGICLGAQLIARAAGAVVLPSRAPEIGWFPVEQARGPGAQAWFESLPRRFEVFHWHGETFTVPTGAERILFSRDCLNQAFVLETALALQCHVEMTAEMVRTWSTAAPPARDRRRPRTMSAEEMCERLDERVAALNHVADVVLGRWAAAIP